MFPYWTECPVKFNLPWETLILCIWECMAQNVLCPPNCFSHKILNAANPQLFSTAKIKISRSHFVLDLVLFVCRQNGFCVIPVVVNYQSF